MVERDPNDEKDVIVEIQGGTGGEEAGLWAGDIQRMLTPLRRAPRLRRRAARDRRRQVHLRDQGRRRLLGVQVRGRHAPRPARAGDREPGPHPHLDRDRRRAARGRGGRRADRPGRPPDRRLPLERPGRPVGQHDRLGGARDAPPVRASSSRCRTRSRSCRTARRRCACCARASTSARSPSSRRRRRPTAARRSAPASARRRSAPTTSPSAASPTTASSVDAYNLDAVLDGDARRVHGRAPGRREAPPAGGAGRRRMSRAIAAVSVRDALDGARHRDRGGRLAERRAWTPSCCSRTRSGRRASGCTASPARRSPAEATRAFQSHVRRRAGDARAGRLHPRPPRVPPPRAGGRPRACCPAARDRAARRAGARARRAAPRVLDCCHRRGRDRARARRRAARPAR